MVQGKVLTDFEWVIRSDDFNEWFMSDQTTIEDLSSGLEATVYKIKSKSFEEDFVLKLWDKRPPRDVWNQYYLLEKLNEIGLPVSKPYALGQNSKGEYGLITSFDGTPLPLECIQIRNIRAMANLMARVHKTEISQINRHIPNHEDFIGYFFQITEEHSDISHLIQEILNGITISSDCLIHGDLNPGNVVVSQGKYTIIDWTNVQLGDRRYDFAWASFLILIYSGDKCYKEFIDDYNELFPIDSAELYIFEIIACLRWIWLSRIAPVPIFNNTKSRVKEFIHKHKELQAVAFVD